MKKLALVIVLAVVASRLLSTHTKEGRDQPQPRRLVVSQDNDRPAPAPRKPSKTRIQRITPVSSPAQAPAKPRQLVPAWFPKTEIEEEALAKPDDSGRRVLLGRVSVSEDRARIDLRKTLENEVRDWLAADVPPSWTPPALEIEGMVLDTTVQPTTRSLLKPGATASATETTTPDLIGLDDLYTLYRAGQRLDFSSARRDRFIDIYRQELANHRMQRLGGGLALALAALALLSTYIKTDEATKGYYTNRLRLLAAAGLGGAGVLVYRLLG